MKKLVLFLILAGTQAQAQSQTPFSTDSAASYLTMIAVDIGPRTIGSPNERKAMEFGLKKFREFGMTGSYLMEMKSAHAEGSNTEFNTSSGVVVGVLPGKTGKIIVIGGHIDSALPEGPGTNDDGSGAASVIELARVLSTERLQSTLIFCLFGGEEAGLCGSEYFVNHFLRIDSVALMLQLDMANGSEDLIPFVNSGKDDSPEWLAKAAFEEYGKLGYSGLCYPTHFFAFNRIFPNGGVGADHEPFLEHTIPAIDFTSDMNDPIHTPQDDFSHFKINGLKRSGDLVYNLIHRFDGNVPREKTSQYYLYQIGNIPLFIPLWVLRIFIALTVLLAVVGIVLVRKRRSEIDKTQRKVVPGLKLFLLAIIIQACAWFSENLLSFIKGIRYPWINDPSSYIILGFFGGAIGVWLSLQLIWSLKLSRDPYRWFLRTAIFLFIFIILLALINVQLALYPATALFFLTLAMYVRLPLQKLVLWFISIHLMYHLVFSEGFAMFSRMMALHSPFGIGISAATQSIYAIFYALWFFPFLLGFAAIYCESTLDLLWLKKFKTRNGLLAAIVVFVAWGIYLITQPSYSDEWRQNIRIENTVNLNSGQSTITIKSPDYMKDARIVFNGKDTLIHSFDREILLKKDSLTEKPWLTLSHTLDTKKDSTTSFDLITTFHFKYRPYTFSVTYSAGTKKITNVSTLLACNVTEHTIGLRWESFPDTVLLVPLHFQISGSDSVIESIEARFVETTEPIKVEKALTNVSSRTIVEKKEILAAKQ